VAQRQGLTQLVFGLRAPDLEVHGGGHTKRLAQWRITSSMVSS
jgi:hypothetical protein